MTQLFLEVSVPRFGAERDCGGGRATLFWGVGVGVFRDRVSLCSPGCPGTHSVDQAGLESAGIKGVRHTPGQESYS